MNIRKTTLNDMNIILDLYEQSRKFMALNGNSNQWIDNYPQRSLLEEDIESGHSYVCVDDDKIVGTFFYIEGNDLTYAKIYEGHWLNDKLYGVVHRLASAQGKRGVATFCMNWCFDQCKNIRIDTHIDNIPMQNLLNKNGYTKCGIIYISNGDERIAFQKTI